MTTQLDELVHIIQSPESFDGGPISCGPNGIYAARTANAILAAGYTKPRQVTTASELNALGFYAVILDAYDTPHVCERWATDKSRAEWAQAGTNALIDSEDVLYHGPATVLYSPVVAP